MNSWKTVNFTKQYGSHRIFFLSSLTMVLCFIIFYVPAQFLFETNRFYDNYFFLLIFALWFIYPLHKLFHFLPIAHVKEKMKTTFGFKYGIIPNIQIQVYEPVTKRLFMLALLSPFIVINCLLIGACYLFPHYVHYFTILLAYHVGICLPDMICAKNVISAPIQSYIEENDDGIEILLQNYKE